MFEPYQSTTAMHINRLHNGAPSGGFRLLGRKMLLIWLLIAGTLVSKAGVFPVELTPQLIPPYSVYLPDYASPGSEKLRIVLLQRDLTVQGYQLRLEMKIQLNGVTIMQTTKAAVPPPIILQPGLPTIVGGNDLYWYLQPQNLEFGNGYSRSTYEQTRSLPEGVITICFTAYDYNRREVAVSREGCTSAYLAKTDPPLLNYPACGMHVNAVSPQFVSFSWLPRNTASLNSSLETEYIFSLWEIRANGYNFQDIVQSTSPVYTIRTGQPNLMYGPAEPPLTPGFTYAWRVQAVDKTGRDAFRNNGLSEACSFVYGGDSSGKAIDFAAIRLFAAADGAKQGKVWWASDNKSAGLATEGYQQYKLYYRKTQGTWDWFSTDVSDTLYRLFGLEPNTSYECRLQGYIGGSYGPYTDIVQFTTGKQKAVSCGDSVNMLQAYSGKPLTGAIPGMMISYGPWEVQLLSVTPLGQPGGYKGTCKVTVPFMGNMIFNARFDNITIDDSRHVTAGNIEFLTQGLQQWADSLLNNQMGGSGYGKVLTGGDTTNVTVNVSLANLDHLDVVLGPDSTITQFTIPGNPPVVVQVNDNLKAVTIKDANGDTYVLDNTGKLVLVSKHNVALQSFFANPQNLAAMNTLAPDQGVVTFTEGKGRFAFDAWKPFYAQATTVLTGQYEKLSGGGQDYYVAQKAIGAGESDVVGLKIGLAPGLVPDSLVFANSKGTMLIWDKSSNSLNLVGGPAADAQEVFALYPKPGGNGYYSLGKLLVSAYEKLNYAATIVPVASADGSVPDVKWQQWQDSLNSIYNKVNIFWSLTADSALTSNSWDANHDGRLDISGSKLFSNALNGEPNALIKLYKQQRPIDKTRKYIFAVKGSTGTAEESTDLAGDMPRGTRYGFVFLQNPDQQNPAITLAHELGHGQFNLEHTFSANIGLGAKGATVDYPNLMDYVSAAYRHLYKYQWNQLHEPGQVTGIAEDDSESQDVLLGGKLPAKFLNKDLSTYTFLTPSGSVIVLPGKIYWPAFDHGVESNKYLNVVTGVLTGFTEDKIEYKADIDNNGNFLGYKSIQYGIYYQEDSYTRKTPVDRVVMGIPGEEQYMIYALSMDAGRTKYSFTKEPVRPENSIGLSLFEGNAILEGKSQAYSYNTDVFGNGQLNISQSEIDAIHKYNAKSTLLYVLKIEQIKQMSVDLFDKFSYNSRYLKWTDFSPREAHIDDVKVLYADLGEWDKYVRDNVNGIKDLWDKGSYNAYFAIMLDSLKAFVVRNRATSDDFWDKLTINTPMWDMHVALTLSSNDQLSSLSIGKRILALKIATKGCLLDMNGYFDENAVQHKDVEANVIRLITCTPVADGNRLLDSLVMTQAGKGGKVLLAALLEETCGINGPQFVQMVSAIHNFAAAKYKYDKSIATVARDKMTKRFLSFDPSFWTNAPITIDYNDDGTLNFAHRIQFTNYKYDRVIVNPYDTVTLYFQDDKMTDAFTLRKDQVYTTSGIMAYLLLHDVIKTNLKTGGMVLVNVALLPTGLGELSTALQAGKVGAVVWASADIGIAVAGILVETKYRDKWMQTENGRKLLAYWEAANLVYAGTRITVSIINSTAEARAAAEEMRQTAADDAEKAVLAKTKEEADALLRTALSEEEVVIDLAAAEKRYQREFESANKKPFGLQMTVDEVEQQYGQMGKDLVLQTEQKAKEILDARSAALAAGKEAGNPGPVLAGIVDTKTGKIYFGQNLKTQAEMDAFKENLHPVLRERLKLYQMHIDEGNILATPLDIARAANPGTHAEIVALDEALKARGANFKEADLQDFLLHNRRLGGDLTPEGIPLGCPPRCLNCWHLSDLVKVIGND